MAAAFGAAEPGRPAAAGVVTVRPVECVVCGGAKHTQRGFCCEGCMTVRQRERWRRQKAREKAARARTLLHTRSAPVAHVDGRLAARGGGRA